ncbi:MAG: hypothetical protein ABMA13_22205 [Chthoniobacteraceae bacterium]
MSDPHALTRDEVLDAEFTRPPLPGQRLLSAGIFRIARAIGLAFALPSKERAKLSEAESDREMIAVAWLLDAGTPLLDIQRAGEMSRDDFFAQIIAPYEFTIGPERIALAKAELARTNSAVEAALYVIAPKPQRPGDPPPEPPGKS